MRKKFGRGALFAILLATAAWAGPIANFPLGPGKVWYGTDNGGHDAVGLMKINELILGSETLSVLNGNMNFKTGKSLGTTGGDTFFAPGGTFTVRGCVDLDGGARCDKHDIRKVLVSGTFLSTEIMKEHGETILVAQFVEYLNPELAALLKLPDTALKGTLEMVLSQTRSTPVSAAGQVDGGYLSILSLSEPASILLLGTMIATFAGAFYFTVFIRKHRLPRT